MAIQSGPRWVSAIDRVDANQGWPLRGVPLYSCFQSPGTHTQLRYLYPDCAHVKKIPTLHNFTVHIPEWGGACMEMKLLVLISNSQPWLLHSSFFYACRAVHNFFHLGGNVISWSRVNGYPVAIHSSGVWGHVPSGNFGETRCSEVHSEAYREARKASWEESHHHNHHCLLSYWNTGNHLHWLGSILQIYYLDYAYTMHALANACMPNACTQSWLAVW